MTKKVPKPPIALIAKATGKTKQEVKAVARAIEVALREG